ncbi:HAD family hydrolase, partial [Tannerella forsythia]
MAGDDPASEIKAGPELGFTTVLMVRKEYLSNPYTDYIVSSFEGLRD